MERCTHWIDEQGAAALLDPDTRRRLLHSITTMASCGLRTLALAVRSFDSVPSAEDLASPPEEALTLLCVVGIKVRCLHMH